MPEDNPRPSTALSQALAGDVYRAAVEAVRADNLIFREVERSGERLLVCGSEVCLDPFEEVIVVGAGKASAAMAAAIEQVLGDRLSAGIVVTKDGHAVPTRRIEILEAGHPVPDARSLEAGRRILEMAQAAGESTLVLCLLSGGASALMELPENGVSLEDLQATTTLLLRAGAPIDELNVVRACISRIKAGGLALAAMPASVICLALSDVLGNSIGVIGSGPCLPTAKDRARALNVLRDRGLLDVAPASVVALLGAFQDEPPLSVAVPVRHFILGDIWTALRAAEKAAIERGLHPKILTGRLQGEAREVGRALGAIARDMEFSAADCYILGGETTVTVVGEGAGGRSQELAAAAALAMDDVDGVALLAAGTDGTDGPTDAAGGVVQGVTAARALASGHDLADALRNSDTYTALDAAGALFKTGPTHTNVGDLVVIVRSG